MLPRMIRALLALSLVAFAAPVAAADRSYIVTAFDRIRVDGPFEVRVTVGGGGGAKASASGDARVLAGIEITVQGSTLIVRQGGNGWNDQRRADGPAPVIVLAAPELKGATVIGGGKLSIAGTLRGARLDFAVTGTGSIDARGIDAQAVNVSTIGAGTVALAGRAATARLLTNGSGVIAATPLTVGDVTVRLDGPGETMVTARYTATLTSTGLGRIVVAGNPKCTAKAIAGGPIRCGPGTP